MVRESYYWPDQQLNFWILIMLAAGGLLIGVFASFIQIQHQTLQGIPWFVNESPTFSSRRTPLTRLQCRIMPFGIAVGSLTVIFILIMLGLIFQRRLLPGVVMLGSFILLVLYITGAVETALQLFGPQNDINTSCRNSVANTQSYFKGANAAALAWLEQNNICNLWDAVFAFWIIGAVFLTWMLVLGFTVARGGFGSR